MNNNLRDNVSSVTVGGVPSLPSDGNKKRKGPTGTTTRPLPSPPSTSSFNNNSSSSSIMSVALLPAYNFGGDLEEERSSGSCFLGMKRGVTGMTTAFTTTMKSTKETTTTTTTDGGHGRGDDTHHNTHTHDTHHDAMDFLAKEMNRLSIKEREQAYEDLHGVSETINETSELIIKSLQQMEDYIQTIKDKPAYDLAVTIDQGKNNYIHHPKLRLMFLRADRYNIELSSKRFINFLNWKLKLFGPQKLCQWYIGLDELDFNTQKTIESGFIQILSQRDSRGRPIIVIAANYHRYYHISWMNELQMVYYIYMSLMEDEMNQMNGIIQIGYTLGKEQPPKPKQSQSSSTNPISEKQLRDSIWDSCSLITCLPIRVDALHFLHVPHTLQHGLGHVANGIGKYIRARLRVHFGSHIECCYALETFGIPSSVLPFTTTGELKVTNHTKWILRRKVKDHIFKPTSTSTSTNGNNGQQDNNIRFVYPTVTLFPGIDLPSRNDVLLGKGRPIQSHPGNQRLQELTRNYLEEYDASSKNGGRTIVAQKIINGIRRKNHHNNLPQPSPPTTSSSSTLTSTSTHHGDNYGTGIDPGSGGRFLQLCTNNGSKLQGWWEEVTNEEILIEKVCNGLRNARRRKTPAK